jgi:hypothetical protein
MKSHRVCTSLTLTLLVCCAATVSCKNPTRAMGSIQNDRFVVYAYVELGPMVFTSDDILVRTIDLTCMSGSHQLIADAYYEVDADSVALAFVDDSTVRVQFLTIGQLVTPRPKI